MQPIPSFEVVMNAGSGRTKAQARKACVERVLRGGGRKVEVRLVRHPRELPQQIAAAIAAAQASGGAVVAAGGDGTINAVVQQVLGSGLLFGALPQGTFNFFGRNHGLSEDIETAARDLLQAQVREVQVGLVNDRVFLINASLGLYRRLLQDRERYKQRLGRARWVALWAGLRTLLGTHRQLNLCMRGPQGEVSEEVLTLVACNNRLQLEGMGLDAAGSVEKGRLLGVRLRPQSRMALFKLALRGLAGRWADTPDGEAFGFDSLLVTPTSARRATLRVGLDGEVVRMRPPLEFKVSEQRLSLLVPADAGSRGV
jgi:diacylglycerol kinase family enzyme